MHSYGRVYARGGLYAGAYTWSKTSVKEKVGLPAWRTLRGGGGGGGVISGEIRYSYLSFSYLSFFYISFGPHIRTVVRILCRTDPTIAL